MMHRYGVSILVIAFAVLLEIVLRTYILPIPGLVYAGAVAFTVWYGGTGPGVINTGLGAVALLIEYRLSNGAFSTREIGLLLAYLAIAGLITYLGTHRPQPVPETTTTPRPDVVRLTDYLREKRRDSSGGLSGTGRRGPLVIAYDLRSHYELAHLTATELAKYMSTSDDAKQLYAYLRWAHEQIERDTTCLEAATRPATQQASSDNGKDTK
jgi:hypothetical protein